MFLLNVPFKRYFIDFMGLRRIDTLSRRIDISLETIAPDNGNFRKIDSCLKRRGLGTEYNSGEYGYFDFTDTHANGDRFFFTAYGSEKKGY